MDVTVWVMVPIDCALLVSQLLNHFLQVVFPFALVCAQVICVAAAAEQRSMQFTEAHADLDHVKGLLYRQLGDGREVRKAAVHALLPIELAHALIDHARVHGIFQSGLGAVSIALADQWWRHRRVVTDRVLSKAEILLFCGLVDVC